jgi:hypothetical protein
MKKPLVICVALVLTVAAFLGEKGWSLAKLDRAIAVFVKSSK